MTPPRLCCAEPQRGMKTGAGRGILVVLPGQCKPVSIWCFEPVCESGRTLCWYNPVLPFVRGTKGRGPVSPASSLLPPGVRAREGMSGFFSASTPRRRKDDLCRYHIPAVAALTLTTGAAIAETLSPNKRGHLTASVVEGFGDRLCTDLRRGQGAGGP